MNPSKQEIIFFYYFTWSSDSKCTISTIFEYESEASPIFLFLLKLFSGRKFPPPLNKGFSKTPETKNIFSRSFSFLIELIDKAR